MSTITFDFRHYYQKGERRESDQIAYQWDLGHVAEIYVPVNATYEIHYCFADFTETDDYEVESIAAAEDGGYKLTAHIPNELFERSGELKVYVIGADDNHVLTTYEGYITIRGRTKPEDYVDDDPENEATRVLTEAREARDAAIEAAEQAEAAASQSAAQASIAEVYDATTTYAIGDYCLHDGQLYECTTEITTPEAWTAAHWTATTVGTELNEINDDVTDLKEDYAQILDSAYVTDTASGAIASFQDGANNVPVKSLTVNIEPVQSGSGDPSPDNVRPISGHTQAVVTRTGKNLIPTPYQSADGGEVTVNGMTFTPNNDGSITLNGTAAANAVYYIRSSGTALNLKKGTYTVKGIPGGSSSTVSIRIYASETIGYARSNDFTFTLDEDTRIGVSLYAYSGYTANNLTIKPLLEVGSISSEWEPYQGQTVTIDLDGTCYGGTLDVTTGVLTVDRAIIELSENWAWAKSSSYPGGYYTSRESVTPTAKDFTPFISSHAKTARNISEYDYGTCFFDGSINFRIMSADSTLQDWKDYIVSQRTNGTPITMCYTIEQSLTYTLTPQDIKTLLGTNNIWSDAGDVEVDYRADTKLYIEKLTAPTEDDMIADHAIAANSFFMVGNNLYRATTAIASGATITVGTNATKLSLSDALNALA